MQPSLFPVAAPQGGQTFTVSKLTFFIRKLLEENETLQDVWVQGEISNLSRPASGHIYFTLKDANAALKCVMWKLSAQRLNLSLRDGMAVEVHGKIGIYEPQGVYQLYADQIRPVGEGALYQEFMRLKAMLEAEGLFDPEHKPKACSTLNANAPSLNCHTASVSSRLQPARHYVICSIR